MFSIAGIPVRVQLWFFLMIGALGFFLFPPPEYTTYFVSWMVIATVSILLHEFGHAIAFRMYGLRPSITLHGMGGLTSASTSSGSQEFTPGRSIVTSLAGPLSALFLFGLPALVIASSHGYNLLAVFDQRVRADPAEVILSQIIYVNVGWSLLNLIPILPLDGGNVMASLSEIVAPANGRRFANVVSIGMAVLFAVWGMSVGILGAPIFAAMFIGLNVMEMSRGDSNDADHELAAAARALIDYDPIQAEQLAWAVLTGSPSGERLRWATELTVWARLARGDNVGAQQAMASLAVTGGASASLLGAMALASGRTAEGVSTLVWAFAHDDHKPAKVLGAMAAAQSGQVAPITHELLQLGPSGVEAARLFESLLDYAGHGADAQYVSATLAALARPGQR